MTEEKPGVEERYIAACGTSNLKMEMDHTRRSNADVLVAAGLSQSRFGALLLRLHSEWDGAARPRRIGPDVVAKQAETLAGTPTQRLQAAQRIADTWYLHEAGLLFGRLKTMPESRGQLAWQLRDWKVEDPVDVAAAVLLHWLNPVCPVCNGQKFQLCKKGEKRSTKACTTCKAAGTVKVPYGETGKRALNWLDECTERARNSMSKRLRTSMGR